MESRAATPSDERERAASTSAALAEWLTVTDGPAVAPRTRRLLRLIEPADSEPLAADEETSVVVRARGRSLDAPDPLVLYEGESWRLGVDGSLRRWDAGGQCWRSIPRGHWSEDDATLVDAGRAAGPVGGGDSEDALSVPVIEGCTYLGGTIDDLCIYGKYLIAFGKPTTRLLSYQAGAVELAFEEIVRVELAGRERGQGAKISDIGFAFPGDREDMAAPAVVRSLVDRTGTDTSIRIETESGDALFHCEYRTPDELRRTLAPFREAIDARRCEDQSVVPTGVGVVEGLRELADLRVRGLLTDAEFALAKAKVLAGKQGP
jgi:hypothetical protein